MQEFNGNRTHLNRAMSSTLTSAGLGVKNQVRDSLMFLVEKDGDTFRFLTCKGVLLQKFGFETDDFTGKCIEDCLPMEVAMRRVISYNRAWEGDAVTYEDEVNGIPYLGSVSPVCDENGNVLQLQGFCVDISEKIKVEKQLDKRENYFHTLIENHPDGIFTLNKDGEFDFINSVTSLIGGYEEDELADHPFMPLIVPEERDRAADYFQRSLNGEVLDFETVIMHKKGHRLYIHVTTIPILIENEVHIIYGIVKDITEQKRNEREVHFLKDRISSMIEHSADSIAIFDRNNRLIRANPAFEHFFGWKEDELIEKSIPYVPEESKDHYLETVQQVLEGKKFTGIETTRIKKDGSRFYVSVSLSPLEDENGNIIGYSAITRDIHTQRIAQDELRNKNEQYKIITEHTMDLINVFDPDGQIKYSSPSHQSILGYQKGEFTQTQWTQLVHPEDLPDLLEAIEQLKQTKESLKMEIRLRKAGGDYIILESYGTAVVNCQSELDSIVTISRDITERKQTEDFLRKSEKLAVLGQLAAGIAHEIRNPLTSLKGFTHLLKANARSEESEYYQIMLSELERINTIVGEFMMLAKPQPKNVKKNDVRRILQEAAALLEAQANLHNIQFILDFDSDLIIDCEADQLKQVFINLMKNGMEAMEEKGGLLFIKAERHENIVTISFTDEGCGIPQDQIPSIGEPFFTTKERGTGLGMMICNKIVENHNGTIEIESEVGEGTTVKLSFQV
ncbi:PAS domain S-box protein [Pseudalkalibacillus sp. Hm43]|uniref:PAS domain S-box protein n=1 Tax=Pseudalkalibacillus sp. Hm43 TaxID=3450742 RepID=UPI003F423744